MIALKLEGRLGNQLFQYAFIYLAAKRLNTTFYLDKSIDNFIVPKYFEIQNDFLAPLDNNIFSINGYKNIFTIHLKRPFYKLLSAIAVGKQTMLIAAENRPDDVFKQLKNNCMYQGFFQSESYFHDFKDEIRDLFRIKQEHIDAFNQIYSQLGTQTQKAVIHVRRSDYVGLDISLPVSYYKNAIETIGYDNIEYIFISDDRAFVEEEFSYIPNKYISTHNEIIDLQFLINADFCILSNSSFSWWGAWLNVKQNKKITAPQYWLGFKRGEEFPPGIANNLEYNWVRV
jgi:hypothetical protein